MKCYIAMSISSTSVALSLTSLPCLAFLQMLQPYVYISSPPPSSVRRTSKNETLSQTFLINVVRPKNSSPAPSTLWKDLPKIKRSVRQCEKNYLPKIKSSFLFANSSVTPLLSFVFQHKIKFPQSLLPLFLLTAITPLQVHSKGETDVYLKK